MRQYLVQAEQAYYMAYPDENSSYPNATMVFNQGLGIFEADSPQEAIRRAIRENSYLYAVKLTAYPINETKATHSRATGYFGYESKDGESITVPLMDLLRDTEGFDDPQVEQLINVEHTVPVPRIVIDCSANPIRDYNPEKSDILKFTDTLQCVLGEGRWYSKYIVDVVNPVNKRQKALIAAWKLGRI